MTRVCRECDEPTDRPIAVALEHTMSCGGRVVYLCPPCRHLLGLMPLDQHPKDSLGYALHETP